MGHWAQHTIAINVGGLFEKEDGPKLMKQLGAFRALLADTWRKSPMLYPELPIPMDFQGTGNSSTATLAFDLRSGLEDYAFAFSRKLSKALADDREVVHTVWHLDDERFDFAVWRDGKLLDGRANCIGLKLEFEEPLRVEMQGD